MKRCVFCCCQIDVSGAILCVLASQVANLCESYVGATLQGRKGYEWVCGCARVWWLISEVHSGLAE